MPDKNPLLLWLKIFNDFHQKTKQAKPALSDEKSSKEEAKPNKAPKRVG